jgi:hypothetical protein
VKIVSWRRLRAGQRNGKDGFTNQEKLLQADSEWARNDPTIQKKYAGQVIGVCDRKVVAAATTIAEIQATLEQLENLPPGRTVVVPIGV